MIVEELKVSALKLSNVDGLDPVVVYLQDLGPGQGVLTVTCFGVAWTSWWGGMGETTLVREFVARTDVGYLMSCLKRGDYFHSRLTRRQDSYLERICELVIEAVQPVQSKQG